ncbi:MAG: NAD-dependent epimerase/dehydratase family protein [Candidatus Omnitrophica bacterium]|nr:NAD-dependent epimerase/dehydratase family protein [Candidatus Omnitrophota bacterium]
MKNFKALDKILVIGGTGFIGSHLVKRCLKDTENVSVLSLPEKTEPIKDVEYITADLCDKPSLAKALKARAFDYVFNLGGYIDHTHYFKGGRRVIEAHLIGLMNLLDSIDWDRLKGFVQIGSSDEYGGLLAPQNEAMREMSISPYSFAKTAASHFIQMISKTEDFPGVVARFFLVYGPGQDDRRFLPQIIKACLNGEEFKTSEGKQLRDFCYVEDAVQALAQLALSNSAKGKIFNVGSGQAVTIREMVEKIVKITGKGTPLWGTYPYRKGENMQLYADTSLIKEKIGWQPQISLEEGLKRTVEFYKISED